MQCDMRHDMRRDLRCDLGRDMRHDMRRELWRDLQCDLGHDLRCNLGHDLRCDLRHDFWCNIRESTAYIFESNEYFCKWKSSWPYLGHYNKIQANNLKKLAIIHRNYEINFKLDFANIIIYDRDNNYFLDEHDQVNGLSYNICKCNNNYLT